MKFHFAFLAAAVFVLPSAHSALIYQTQNYSNVTTGSSLVWNKFDTTLGTLTGIEFTLDGTLSGSFSVTNTDDESNTVTISNPNAYLRLTLTSSGPPDIVLSGAPAIFATSPAATSATPFVLAPSSSQTFNIDPSPFVLTSYTSLNLISNAAYFSGAGTFTSQIARVATVTRVGGNSTQSFSQAVASGTIGLTYTYTPTEVIPEPGTWAAAALLVGGAAFMRWRKHQSP